MPRLPSVADLERPIPRPTGGIVGYQPATGTGLEYRAIAEAGRQVTDVGQDLGRTIKAINEQVEHSRRASELSDALGMATSKVGELEIAFNRDPEFKTVDERFSKQVNDVGTNIYESIQDPIVKESFRNHFTTMANAKRLNVLQAAATHEQEYNVASLDSNLDVFAKSAALARNPAEQQIAISQARIAIQSTRLGGWISAVDAVKRDKSLLGKVDSATVIRDMSIDAGATADRLAFNENYAPNLEPVVRERLIDHGYRRADQESTRNDRILERERKKNGDAALQQAFSLMDAGTLTRGYIEKIRPLIDAKEYKGLLNGLKEGPIENDKKTFARIEGLLLTDPQTAIKEAFAAQDAKLIKNDALSSFVSKAITYSSQGGPRTPYERERAYVTNTLRPSEMVMDPAPAARYALAISEFDDFAEGGKRTAEELRKSAREIVQRYSLVDMADLARRTGIGAKNDPKLMLEDVANRGRQLEAENAAGRIPKAEYNRKLAELNELRKKAEAAQAAGAQIGR